MGSDNGRSKSKDEEEYDRGEKVVSDTAGVDVQRTIGGKEEYREDGKDPH